MLDQVLDKELIELRYSDIYRELPKVTRYDAGYMVYHDGKKLISFSCNNYLGLIGHPLLKKSAIDAINLYGVGAGASRMVTGDNLLYYSLESKLAKLYDKEKALVFSSGYLTNIGIISALVNRHDMIISDKLVHSSIIDGIKLSQAKNYRFKHNDYLDCEYILKKYRNLHRRCLIIVEQVYSMDGDIAPTKQLKMLAEKYDAWLVIDCAHSFGLMMHCDADIYIGTLSKAVGVLGGYVCASEIVIKYIQNKARTFIYTTALPPMIIAAANSALDIIGESVIDIPIKLARFFCNNLDFPEPNSHIVPIIMKDVTTVLHAQKILKEEGFLVIAIRPPTSPTPRLRFVFNASHKLSDVKRLCKVLKQKEIV
ncbi:8-amino-7-oxononanoate synthase [Ehrlichia ruminantium]|uniref:5-aminolevulinate synthase n=1 Tax=Ehrlichia ruminantium (strain Welgevonden) TaxID=254945 RepID=A0A0H3M0J8_EHRRW|nr:8-amino-7-oxononanoate synthase [Ehrlichia ruminantium]KYW94112.1 8-amino-7-oxononanoate synthase [Ehrlichia ruminantium]QLK50250.1 8-amino-7-oxononanoate synthase [Ehrlichia ruminantium]QLK51175.1 8-amino-7-oxononanoate synthase [Ehrlichia ruminantium]QLK53009.1 8-amino-7-oxononanoate synthase [Ehrlichia ruminantium]QLK54847.1 8-amino-7-oxononanoate synthase [Ehrlichia ruminantium]